jgi:hypothetical protein
MGPLLLPVVDYRQPSNYGSGSRGARTPARRAIIHIVILLEHTMEYSEYYNIYTHILGVLYIFLVLYRRGVLQEGNLNSFTQNLL